MPPAIAGSGGHSQTYAAATALVHGFGIEPLRAMAILQTEYNPRCNPPWSDRELQHKINQAAAKPHDRPFGWLRDEGPIEHNDSDVDLSKFMREPKAVVSVDDEPETNQPPGPDDPGVLPEHLLRIPWFHQRSHRSLPRHGSVSQPGDGVLRCARAPVCLGRTPVRDPGDNRTNLYLLGLAHSAAGKDWPRKINIKIMQKIGHGRLHRRRFASGEGIQDSLMMTPSMLFQTDEIDGLLQSINKSRDARHEQIMSTL